MYEKLLAWMKEHPKAALSLALSLASGLGMSIPTWIWPLISSMQAATGQ
ncbi:MAG: hypothetical protein KQH53_08245 [Desulfarculaceae bacterium]|nr:hypothetical protein [Desulfarculaceae bacterium]